MGHAAHNVERAVTRGVARQSLKGLRSAGLDEKSFGRGHDTVSVPHDLRRVLEVVPERTREAANTLWAAIPEPQRQAIDAVAMDMWVPYLEATRSGGSASPDRTGQVPLREGVEQGR